MQGAQAVEDHYGEKMPEKQNITEMKGCTWSSGKQPTQKVLELAAKCVILGLQELNPPAHAKGHTSWRGMQRCCAN